MSQAVSDLTATDAHSFVVASVYVTIYKMFNCLLICISSIGYAIFPLFSSGFDGSFQTIMHEYVITT